MDSGQLVATSAASLSWEYRYTLNVVITDFTGDQNLLMAPVLLWLRDNQPDALQNSEARERLFSFEVDILANDRCDISMDLKLTERVIATIEDGKARIEAVLEPDATEEFWTVKHG